MKKRFLSILLALSMVLTFLPLNAVTAFAEDTSASGKCGENLTWTLDSNGILTISGTGAMWDYNSNSNDNKAPWYDLKSQIKQVTLEDGVTSIGTDAFYSYNNYSNLKSVSIPDSVTSIGSFAFQNCISLDHVKIPDGVTIIQADTFNYCSSLSDITLPKNLTRIASYAFRSCYSLKSIVIPDGVTSIGESAFSACNSLASITLPNSVTSIGPFAFSDCQALTTVAIPDGVTYLPKYVFRGCTALTTITLPGSVTSIDEYAFSDCSSLSTIRYAGTQEQWDTLEISQDDNNAFLSLEPTFVSSLTVTNGSFTCLIDGKKVTKSSAMVPSGTKVTVTFDKAAFADSSSKFSYWDIDGLDDPNAYQNQESFTFIMPGRAVTLEAMTQDESIDDAVAEVLGTAAMVTTAVAGTAVLAYTGYQIGTELYLTYLLPSGAAIPANTAQLAELVWTDAGKPAPAAVLPEDAAEDQQAMAWAAESGLISADKPADASVSRIEVIRTWKKAQSGKVG